MEVSNRRSYDVVVGSLLPGGASLLFGVALLLFEPVPDRAGALGLCFVIGLESLILGFWHWKRGSLCSSSAYFIGPLMLATMLYVSAGVGLSLGGLVLLLSVPTVGAGMIAGLAALLAFSMARVYFRAMAEAFTASQPRWNLAILLVLSLAGTVFVVFPALAVSGVL